MGPRGKNLTITFTSGRGEPRVLGQEGGNLWFLGPGVKNEQSEISYLLRTIENLAS